jgi:hypothetical protein
MFESGSFPFFDGIGQIISFQVPIYSEKKKHGWGSIDLLGMDDSDGYPVVIELKIAKKTIEPALRAVIEAVSYMIALRGNWADFAPEWSKRTKRGEISAPKTLTALVLAPSDYWTTVEGDEYLKDALRNLKDLVNALADCCYAVRFGSIEAKDSGDWRITGAAKEISIPFP